jgi:hypothetical protein
MMKFTASYLKEFFTKCCITSYFLVAVTNENVEQKSVDGSPHNLLELSVGFAAAAAAAAAVAAGMRQVLCNKFVVQLVHRELPPTGKFYNKSFYEFFLHMLVY